MNAETVFMKSILSVSVQQAEFSLIGFLQRKFSAASPPTHQKGEKQMKLVEKTIGRCLRETAERYGEQTAIEFGDWTCTWAELDEVTDLLAARFYRDYGIRTGIHVGIWSLNSPAFVQACLALYKLGAVVVVFNAANSVDEMADQLTRSDTEVLFYGAGFRDSIFDEMIPRIRKKAPAVRHFLHIEERESGVWLRPDSFSEESRKRLPMDQVYRTQAELPAKSPACIIFTSGTTSKPKAVVLTHYGIVNVNLHVQKCMRWTHEDKVIVAVSMYHGFGLNTGLAASAVIGMTMHLIPSFRTQAVWEAIDRYRCTVMLGVPSMYLALVRREDSAQFDGSALRSGIVGGSVITTEEYREICRRFPDMHLIPSFGMTEASTSGSFSDWDDPLRSGQITGGCFYEDTMARIRDVRTGEIIGWNEAAAHLYASDTEKKNDSLEKTSSGLEQNGGSAEGKESREAADSGKNRSGELELAGFNLFREYYRMPEATAEAFTEDGWLRTGDIGYFNDFDEICLTGRKKELIIRAGENISPREIEKAILASGMTKKVRAVGVPSTFTQEEIAACIVTEEGEAFDAQALLEFLQPRLSYFKIPKYIFTFRQLPVTASGKVRLGELKEIAAQRAADTEALRKIGSTKKGSYYTCDVQ